MENENNTAPLCPKCNVKTYLTSFRYIKKKNRKHSYRNNYIYMCPVCHNYVNTHYKTNISMGIPADKELRYWRAFTHKVFDYLWRKNGNRQKTYNWLARKMNIDDINNCHIGMFNIDQCKKTINLCIKQLAENY